MTISQVIYVLEAADSKSISLAAERLYISQSAISQQILRLERELGYSLFSRTVHGLELTEAGARFCEEARPAAEAWNTLCRRVQADNTQLKKPFRIGMGSRVYSNGLFPQIVDFFDKRPEIEVSFITDACGDFLIALRQQSIDVALDILPSDNYLDAHSEFYSCPLICERQCVLMAESDPRARLPGISFERLQGSTMISGLENTSEARALREICRRHGITLDRVYRSDGIGTIMNLVRNGRGLILGPESFAEYYHVAAVPLMPESSSSLHFICARGVHRKEIREFRDFLIELCKDK